MRCRTWKGQKQSREDIMEPLEIYNLVIFVYVVQELRVTNS